MIVASPRVQQQDEAAEADQHRADASARRSARPVPRRSRITHSGTEAIRRAARPEGTVFSATDDRVGAREHQADEARRQQLRAGRPPDWAPRRQARIGSRISPTAMKRVPAAQAAAGSSRPSARCARYVEPQTM